MPGRPRPSFEDSQRPTALDIPIYPSIIRRPFADPHETLCHYYNVAKLSIQIKHGDSLPEQITMPVLQDAHMPTHVIIITQASSSSPSDASPQNPDTNPLSTYPLLAPLNLELFAARFSNDISRRSPLLVTPGSTMPIPYWDSATQQHVVCLPAIPLSVPHPPSIPLLLLFGLALHLELDDPADSAPASPKAPPPSPSSDTPFLSSEFVFRPILSGSSNAWHASSRRRSNSRSKVSTGLLATYLLPTRVIEEFPAAAAMADVMARTCTDAELEGHAVWNHGMWRNVLALVPKDKRIIEIVSVAWTVTAEARKVRGRVRDRRGWVTDK